MPVVLPHVIGLAKVIVHGSFGGKAGVNIFHVYNQGSAYTVANLNAVGTGFRSSFKNRFLPSLANGFELGNVDVQDLSSALGNVITIGGTDNGGDISSGNAPQQVACAVSWLIPRHYRGGRPRTYLYGFKNDVFQDTSHFTSAFTTALQTGGNGLVTDVAAISGAGGTLNLVCVHYYQGGGSTSKPPVPLATPLLDAITGCSVNPRVDTQRRRLAKA